MSFSTERKERLFTFAPVERWQAVAVGVSLRTRALIARFIFDAAKVLQKYVPRKYFREKIALKYDI